MIRIRIEDVPSAYRQIHAAEAITRFGVENRLRSVGLAARVAVSRLRGGEFPVVGAPPQRVKITRGIVGCQGPRRSGRSSSIATRVTTSSSPVSVEVARTAGSGW